MFKSDDERWNFGVVLTAVALLSGIAGLLTGLTLNHDQGIEHWLNRYQTLATGCLAIVAAFIAAYPVRNQLREMKTQTAVSARAVIAEKIVDSEKRLSEFKKLDGFLRRFPEALERLGPIKISHWMWDRGIEIDDFKQILIENKRENDRADLIQLYKITLDEWEKLNDAIYNFNLTVHIEGAYEEGYVSKEEYERAPAREQEAIELFPKFLDATIHATMELLLALNHEIEFLQIRRRQLEDEITR